MRNRHSIASTNPKRWVVRKFIQAILGVSLILIASVVWFKHQQQQRVQMREIHYQTAFAFATTFAAQLDLKNLADSAHQILNFSKKPEWLHNVSLHDNQGRLVFDQAKDDIFLQTGVYDDEGVKFIPIVIELKDHDNIAGYLTTSINLNQMQRAHDKIIVANSSNSRLVFFLIAVAGLFVSRTFYKSSMQNTD